MIALDQGRRLQELLERAAQDGYRGRLDVATPFLDSDSRLYRLLLTAARNGLKTRLLTRVDRRLAQYGLTPELVGAGVRVCNVPTLHAKAVMLEGAADRQRLAWIGSANFTTASESSCLELGVMIAGNGATEVRLLTSLKGLLDGWAFAGTQPISAR